MDCPQCGGTLITYALSDHEASVCEDCGYVGIAAEHRGEPRAVESWDEALHRFYRAHGRDAPSVDLHPPLSRPDTEPTESWAEALGRFYARQTDEDTTEESTEKSEDTDGAADGDTDTDRTTDETDDAASTPDDGAETEADASQ